MATSSSEHSILAATVLQFISSQREVVATAGLGHVFGALRVDAFRPVEEFAASMDDLQQRMKNSSKAVGQERIFIHGEKEYEQVERRSLEGIPLNPKVLAELEKIALRYNVEFKR